ncbi:aminotransferase class III-fold pyridoxal phosphate-dependent enzyme [Bradyrhizobium sp. ISRA443]|uniref:aspartate aminotransferase family protein n=1 Tax=unclassified Bradyrhizobium TaxID=2631580 RepID=UPI00247A0DE5|nr:MULTISPECIES: aminotransferase class III-fold pyridoxal phosphate-dependent enzyme [unclassified Bradyrhizobium]WGR92586.1 aminotransferase class III-fold pyridoxal phosphate-dependent enzyme [Bradyrhizobium sp. ISRA435]WGR97012.1 aminotransferase class III-fold pyridoxal phosphate-dependent enzyme [Bradyrhizobium sp. ISRA436]WGS03899.1 aminotransferase class III-fold pyridoxal phosphate-dependent enzyme [Bradyrhizobium sp. ISRA437]WGS10783.1 aminotransferase class III-fold pyridoxal phospha
MTTIESHVSSNETRVSSSTVAAVEELRSAWQAEYGQKHAKSAAANRQSSAAIALTQRTRFNSGMPFPVYVAEGSGAWFTDIDGNRFLDCNAGWNASLFGRGNPVITAAISDAAARLGAPGGAMHPSLIRDEFASLICSRIPGAERVVFAPSGSEANTYALRLARSATGRQKILRVRGGFHGQNDHLLQGGSSVRGLPTGLSAWQVDMPYNDIEQSVRLIEQHASDLAAVIVEPMMTIPGAVHQRNGYLQAIRTAAFKNEVPFILDEIITGNRFAVGGAAELLGIAPPPDLTVIGKMLGGGLPVAAVVGRTELVEQPISASNTHAQNPVTLAASVANMKLATPEVFARVCALGARLREGLRTAAAGLRIPVQVTGEGPCAGIHFTGEEVVDADTAERANQDLWRLMCLGVTNRGLAITSRTFGPIAPYTGEDVEHVISVFTESLRAIDQAAGPLTSANQIVRGCSI